MRLQRSIIAAVLAMAITAFGCASIVRDGRKMLEAGRYDGAIDLFNRHLTEEPEDWKTREQLGYAHLKNGQYPDAIREFEVVHRQRPASADTLLYLGLAYLKDSQLENGIATWRTLIEAGSSRQRREIRRLLVLLEIAESRKFAAEAISAGPGDNPAPLSNGSFSVLYYNDLSAEKGLRAVQKSLAAMILADLAQVEGLEVVSRFRMDALLDATNFKQTGLVDDEEVKAVGSLVGSEHLLYGTLSTLLKDLRVNSAVAESRSGSVIATFLISQPLDDFYKLQKNVVFSALERTGYSVSKDLQKRLSDPHTEDFNAFLHFGLGLDALDAGEWETAKLFFERAVDEDSGFDLAETALETCPTGAGIEFGNLTKMGLDARANAAVTRRLEEIVEGLASFPD